jgi:hypothetical protein
MTDGKKTISWTDEHETYLQSIHAALKADGIALEWKGEPNASAIILYALKQAAKRKRKAEKGDRE